MEISTGTDSSGFSIASEPAHYARAQEAERGAVAKLKKERQVILMDWGSWSPSHTILVLFIVAGFVGQLAIYFYRTGQNDKKIDKQGETFVHALERLEERMDKRFSEMIAMSDKRFVEVNQRIGETNQRIDGLRSEMNQRLSDMDASIQQMNQNHIEHLNRHHSQ